MTGPLPRLRRRAANLIVNHTFQRALMGVAIGWNTFNVATSTGGMRLLAATIVIVMVAAQVRIEWSRVRWRRFSRDFAWDLAAASPNPIGSMARSEYLRGLTYAQSGEFTDWMTAHEFPSETDLADAPPVVRGYFEAGARYPRETR